MQVTNVKKIGNNYSLTFDDKSIVLVNEDLLVEHALLVGKKISLGLFIELQTFSDNLYFYDRGVKYIKTKMRSKRQVEKYLKTLEANNIGEIIQLLEHNGYLNDKLYARAYLNDRLNLSSDGPLKIKKELIENNVSEEYIVELFNELDEQDFSIKCEKIISKKLKTLKPMQKGLMHQKLKLELYNLGYPDYMVNEVLLKINYNPEEELVKLIDKLKQKLPDEEVIKKCQRLGFSYYEIINHLKS